MLGLASSGVHSNGFSLVRRLVEQSGLGYDAPAPFAPGQTLGAALLTPTRLYVKSCLAAIKAGGVHALAHITGGGLLENVPRVLPKGCAVEIDAASLAPAAGIRLADARGPDSGDGNGSHLQLRHRHGADSITG